MGIIAIIKSIKEKEKGNLIFKVDNKTILTLPKEKQIEDHLLNRINEEFTNMVTIDRAFGIEMQKMPESSRKIKKLINRIRDEQIKKRLKFIFSSRKSIDTIMKYKIGYNIIGDYIVDNVEIKTFYISSDGKKVRITGKLNISENVRIPFKKVTIGYTQIVDLDSLGFKNIRIKFQKL